MKRKARGRPKAPDPLRVQLAESVRQLRDAQAVCMVACTALNGQAADADLEIEHVLRRHVSDQLDVQLGKLEALLK